MEISTDLRTHSPVSTPPKSSTGVKEIALNPSCKQEPATKSARKYAKYSFETRSAVIDAHERGDDWAQVARLHGVNRRTAFEWISSPEPRRIRKPNNYLRKTALNENEQIILLDWLSDEPRITLRQIAEKVQNRFNKTVSLTTIDRYLQGKVYTVNKECRTVKQSTSIDDQPKQRNSVEQLKVCQFLGKDIVWIDELTLSLICPRARRPNRSYKSVGCETPHLRGRTIQLAVAINRHGILKHLVKEGLYTMDHCLEFVQGLIGKLRTESRLDNVAFVYDDAQCHSKLDELCKQEKVKVIRLVPYSSELNPIERLWDETRTELRRQLRETRQRLLHGNSRKLIHQDTLIECLKQCANAFLTCVSDEHCGQLVDDVLRPFTELDLQSVIKPE